MTPHERDLTRSLTVINRFSVKGNTLRFERELADHCDFLASHDGFLFLVTGRVADQANVYMHFTHWATHQAFLEAVHGDGYLEGVRRLGALAETDADQAVSLGRVLVDNARTGEEDGVLIEVLQDDTEQDFDALFDLCTRRPGFGGGDVLRSTLVPHRYLVVLWWQNQAYCDKLLGEPGYQRQLALLEKNALMRTERLRHLTYRAAFGP